MVKLRNFTYLILSTLIFMIPYSIAPWGNGNIYKDNLIFMKCAQWMSEGQVMYKDLFDHKGPLLYYYDMLGLSVFGQYGIWLLDWVMVIITIYFVYRCAMIFLDFRKSLFVSGTVLLIMNVPFVKDGNSELLAMPATAIACYIFIKRLYDHSPYSILEAFVLCFLFAVCLMTKPNTGAAFIPIILYGVLVLIIQRKYVIIIETIIAGLLGLGIVIIPIFYYLYSNEALVDFYDVYIKFNTSSYGGVSLNSKLLLIIKISIFASFGYLVFVLWIWNNRKEWTCQHYLISVVFLFSIIFNLFPGFCFRHYMLPCIPVFGMVLSLLLNSINKKSYMVLLCTFAIAMGGTHYAIRTINYLAKVNNTKELKMANYINSHCTNHDRIIVLELHDWERKYIKDCDIEDYVSLWKYINCKSASKFFYQYPPFYSVPRFYEQFIEDIRKNKPKYIVCGSAHNKDFENMGYTKCEDITFNILKGE